MSDKFILHWLDESRAHRIVWLMDLLELDYEVKIHLRNSQYRAPKSLKEVYPLGKSPVVEVIFADGSPKLVLAESGHIVQYLVSNYDVKKVLAPSNAQDEVKINYWLHYAEGTLQGLQVGLLVNQMAVKIAPFGAKWLVSAITSRINDAFYGSELNLNLKFLEDELAKGNGNYFVGNKLSAADIILLFPIYEVTYKDGKLQDLTGKSSHVNYPNLLKWCQNMDKQELLQKSIKRMEEKCKEQKNKARL